MIRFLFIMKSYRKVFRERCENNTDTRYKGVPRGEAFVTHALLVYVPIMVFPP